MMNTTKQTEDTQSRVFVVDDDTSVLSAISRLLRSAGFDVQTFQSAREFLDMHDSRIPGCAVLDIGLGELSGLSIQEALSASVERRPVIFLTGCDDVHTGVLAMKAGATDYLTKPVQDTELIAAVHSAIESDKTFRREQKILNLYRANYARLTPREREVMEHVVQGRLNKQIAFDLGTVEKTIKVHRAHIMEKMQVRSVAALVHVAECLYAADAETAR